MDEDLGRHVSAAGWHPKDPWKKHRDKISQELDEELEPCDTMLELRPANAWIEPESGPPAELFGPLWRNGELAVLIGEPQIGKSLLAVQIANELTTVTSDKGREEVTSDEGREEVTSDEGREGVTRDEGSEEGTRDEGREEVTSEKGRETRRRKEVRSSSNLSLATRPSSLEKVLYIDFQRTAAQWTERYSYPTPTLGKFLVPYKFPENFERAGLNWEDVDLTRFKRDPLAFALHSIYHQIQRSNANIVIIDDLTLGGVANLARNATARIMQTLKLWTTTEKLSILVISNSPPELGGVATLRGRGGRSSGSPPYVGVPAGASPRGAALGGVAAFRRRGGSLSRLPKSYALADSIFSLNPSTFGPEYRYIKSLKQSAISNKPPDEVEAYHLASPTPPLPDASTPLLPHFLKFLGPTRELDHHIDYTAEAERILREQRKSLNSARAQLPEFIDIDVLKGF